MHINPTSINVTMIVWHGALFWLKYRMRGTSSVCAYTLHKHTCRHISSYRRAGRHHTAKKSPCGVQAGTLFGVACHISASIQAVGRPRQNCLQAAATCPISPPPPPIALSPPQHEAKNTYGRHTTEAQAEREREEQSGFDLKLRQELGGQISSFSLSAICCCTLFMLFFTEYL